MMQANASVREQTTELTDSQIARLKAHRFFRFQVDSYELSSLPISQHLLNYERLGEDYFKRSGLNLSESQKELIRTEASQLIKEQKLISSMTIAWLRLAAHQVMRIGHSLLCWATPEDEAGERLLMADFHPYQNLKDLSCLVLLKSFKQNDLETGALIESYKQYPLMIVHKDFSEVIERYLQKITRYKEPLRNSKIESFFDIPTYKCHGATRTVSLSKLDISSEDQKSHRLYVVDSLEKVEQDGHHVVKKSIIATVREEDVQQRTNAFLIFCIYYEECAKALENTSLSHYSVLADGSVVAALPGSSEEMCRISYLLNPVMAKVLVACLRSWPLEVLRGPEQKVAQNAVGYFQLRRQNPQQHAAQGGYSFCISSIDNDILFETSYPVVANLAFHELSRMFTGCQEILNRTDPSTQVRINKSRLDGRGNHLPEEDETVKDLAFKGDYGRGGRNEESQKLHEYLKKKGVIGVEQEEPLQQKPGFFGRFWKRNG